jgi:hypothetical protein
MHEFEKMIPDRDSKFEATNSLNAPALSMYFSNVFQDLEIDEKNILLMISIANLTKGEVEFIIDIVANGDGEVSDEQQSRLDDIKARLTGDLQ